MKLQKNWKYTKLEKIIKLEYGKGLSAKKRKIGEFPVVGSNGIIGYHNRALVKGPNIVLGRKGTIGSVTLINKDFWPIDTTYYLRFLTEDIDIKWLYYALKRLNLLKLGLSDVVPGLKRNLVYSQKLLIPPLPEQKKIAEILSAVDQAVEKIDKAVIKTDRLKHGLMKKLLTKGIEKNEMKITSYGKIPISWQIQKIQTIGKIHTGKTPPTKIGEYWNGNIPFITPGDIKGNKYIKKTDRYVTQKGAKKAGEILPKDTILVVCIGSTIGKIGMTYSKSVVNQQINSIICNKQALPNFLYFMLSSKEKMIKSFSGTSAVPIINKSLFQNLKIPFPPLNEQKKISDILSYFDQVLDIFKKRKRKLEKIKKGLMNNLLTGKRRVRL